MPLELAFRDLSDRGWPAGTGGSVSLGDLDGDGVHAEVATGDSTTQPGFVHILRADPATGTAETMNVISAGVGGLPAGLFSSPAFFGYGMDFSPSFPAGPLLAVGAYGDNRVGHLSGAVYLMPLNRTGHPQSVIRLADGEGGLPPGAAPAGSAFGISVCFVNGVASGPMLAIGAYTLQDGAGAVTGGVVLISLNATGHATSTVTLVNGQGGFPAQTLDTDDRFAKSIASVGGFSQPVLAVGSHGDDDGHATAGAAYLLFLSSSDGSLSRMVKLASGQNGIPHKQFATLDRCGNSVAAVDGLPQGPVIALGCVQMDSVTFVNLITLDGNGVATSLVELRRGEQGIPPDAWTASTGAVLFLFALPFPDGSPGTAALASFASRSLVFRFASPPLPTPEQLPAAGFSRIAGVNAAGGLAVQLSADGVEQWNWISDQVTIGGDTPVSCDSELASCVLPRSFALGPQNLTRNDGQRNVAFLEVEYTTTNALNASLWLNASAAPAGMGELPSGLRAGAAVARVGDADGDGCSRDIAIGMPGSSVNRTGAGAVALLTACGSEGEQSLSPRLLLRVDGSVLGQADLPEAAGMGAAVAGLGVEETAAGRQTTLAVGAPGIDSVLVLRTVHSPARGWETTVIARLADGNAGIPAGTIASGSSFGSAIAALLQGGGHVVVFAGAPGRSGAAGDVLCLTLDSSTFRVANGASPLWLAALLPSIALVADDAFGSALAVSHIQGDPTDASWQLLVGAPGDDTGALDAGAMYLVTVNLTETSAFLHQRMHVGDGGLATPLLPSGARFGSAVAWLSDVDGDAWRQEVLVGMPGIAATTVLWLAPKEAGDTLEPFSWATFAAGIGGLPDSLPAGFGSSAAAVGDWNDNGVASDVLIGTPDASSTAGGAFHFRFQAKAHGAAPWGDAVPSVRSIWPQHGLSHDRPTTVTINGTALYQWDPLLGEASNVDNLPTVVVSGLHPALCLDVQVTLDGTQLTCTLKATIAPRRGLSVAVGGVAIAPELFVSFNPFLSSVDTIDTASPVPQAGGASRRFAGIGLLPSALFTRQQLIDTGARLLIGDAYQCLPPALVQSADGSSITCDSMPAGVGGPHPVRLQLPGGNESNSSVSVSFTAPVVASISPKAFTLNTSAWHEVTVSGTELGFKTEHISRLTIGGNECLEVAWVSPTQVDCRHVKGDFANHDVVIWVAGLGSSGGEQLVQFDDPPQIVAMDKAVIATVGNETLQCLGFRLDTYVTIIDNVLVGNRSCLAWSLASSSAIDCVTPPGTGVDLPITIVTSTGYTTLSVAPVSYAPPVLERSSPLAAFADPSIQYDFELSGSGFGAGDVGQVEQVLIGGQSCGSVVHHSDTSLTCHNVSGPWTASAGVSVTVSGQTTVHHDLVTFQDPPMVDSTNPHTLPTAGGVLTIHGSGFGAEPKDVYFVSIGDGFCGNIQVAKDGKQIRCDAPPGVGRDLAVVVSVRRNGASQAKRLLSYEPPAISTLASDSELFAGSTGVKLSLSVSNCGTRHSALRVWLSSSGQGQHPAWRAECTGVERLGNGTDGSDQLASLECGNVSLGGFPDDVDVLLATVTVGNQTSASASISVVGRPQVDQVIPSTGIPTAGTSDPTDFQVQGSNFGFEPSDVLEVAVGGRPCPTVQWDSESLLYVAVPPGVGADQVVRVTTRGGRSNEGSVGMSYKQAEVTELSPAYALTGAGNASFNLTGTDFGNQAADLTEIHVGGQRCTRAVWHSPSWVECLDASRSVWPSRSATVTVGGQQGLLNSYLEPVGPPSISVISPDVADVDETVLVLGDSFGYDHSDVLEATVNGMPCSSISHHGPTALSCVMPKPLNATRQAFAKDPTVLRNVQVVVRTAGGQQSEPANVSYSGAGEPLTAAPMHVLGWRDVGDDGSFNVRWTYPPDDSMPGIDDVESFDVRLSAVENGTELRTISVPVATLEAKSGVQESGESMMVFHHSDIVTQVAPFVVDIRAVNPTAAGPWSEATPPVPANCAKDSFLQTQAGLSDWQCSACPAGAFCGGASAGNVTALAGFWRVPWSRAGLGFVRCPRKESCKGYQGASGVDTAATPQEGANGTADSTWLPQVVGSIGNPPLLPASGPGRRRLASPLTLKQVLARDQVPTAVAEWAVGDPAAMERCEEGYHGTMCTSCEPGYTRWGNFECQECMPRTMVYLAMAGVALLVCVVVAYLIVSAIRSGAEKTPVGTAAIKVAFSHIQTVAIAASFNLQWPDSVLSLFAGMSTATSVSSEVLSLDCALPSDEVGAGGGGQSRFFDKAAIVLAMPLLIVVLACLSWLLLSCCSRASGAPARQAAVGQERCEEPATNNPLAAKAHGQSLTALQVGLPNAHGKVHGAVARPRSLLAGLSSRVSLSTEAVGVRLSLEDKALTSVVVILFLVHMSVTTTSLQLLTCRDIAPTEDPGAESSVLEGELAPAAAAGLASATSGGCDTDQTHRRLVQDLEVCCYDKGAQRSMFGLGIPGLLVYAFGIPVTAALLLWWRRDSLHSHHTKATLGFLYAGFKDEAYYWESVVMLRKVLVAVIAVALEPLGATLQTYTALAVIAALMVLHTSFWPYSRAALNRLELGALLTAYATFECGLFLTDAATSRPMRIIATLAIFLANLMFLLAAVVIILWDKLGIREWRQRRLQTATSAPGRSYPSSSHTGTHHDAA